MPTSRDPVLLGVGTVAGFAVSGLAVETTPPTVTLVAAWTTFVPGVDEVIVAVHVPVVPTVVQVVTSPAKLPGPETIENVIIVPAGALASRCPG